MRIRPFDIEGPLLIEPKRHHDLLGYFCETYKASELAIHGVEAVFVQDNLSLSTGCGTVRGLYFQSPPLAQDRLIRVVRGAIFAVAVDIRAGSPSFGRHVSVDFNAENGLQLFVPSGFAHGFATQRPLTEISIKVSAACSREHEGGIFWADPTLRIRWPVSEDEAVLSPLDETLPLLREIETPFQHAPSRDEAAA
ncbi:MAG: dTDP-4-dehydrorhamnose 3,5-epimerase [Rhodomicrobiaceae bacterium]